MYNSKETLKVWLDLNFNQAWNRRQTYFNIVVTFSVHPIGLDISWTSIKIYFGDKRGIFTHFPLPGYQLSLSIYNTTLLILFCLVVTFSFMCISNQLRLPYSVFNITNHIFYNITLSRGEISMANFTPPCEWCK